MFNNLNKYLFYKNLIWLFLILWIFEGALRKWIFPSIASPLLFVREPIMIYLILVGLYRKWLKNSYVIMFFVLGFLSLMLTLTFGHGDLIVGIYGWRIFAIYIPFMFVFSSILERDDVLRMGRFVLYLSIPMTVLIVLQFFSPQTAWINMGVGGETEGGGFQGALGYFRPTATFSFISGYTSYQLLTGCFLFFYLLAGRDLPTKYRIKPLFLLFILICYFISIPFSISRTHLFQTIGIFTFFIFAGLVTHRYIKRIFQLGFIGVFAICIFFISNTQNKVLDVFFARMENANSDSVSGIRDGVLYRYFGTALDAFNTTMPFWGYGLGFGTNASSRLNGGDQLKYRYFNADRDWDVIIGENGILIGTILVFLKVSLCFSILSRSYKFLRKHKDPAPWMLSIGVLLTLPFGNAMGNNPSHYGVLVILVGFSLTLIRKSVYVELNE